VNSNTDPSVWNVHGTRSIYRSEWVELWLDDVEIPGVRRFEHHVLRFPRESVYAVITRDTSMLLLWRHRFITGAWGWEVPAGWVDPGETPEAAVYREVEEETGCKPRELSLLAEYNAISGISDMHFSLFTVDVGDEIGERADAHEAKRVEWVPFSKVSELARGGEIKDAPSLLAISYYLGIHLPSRS
jgi:8-oxo-dGTP pyrophosphatase MutT (NUDIX family)